MSTPEPGDSPRPTPQRILLVEDNDAASKGLSKFLIAMGYEVHVVIDGTSALEALRTSPPPDFVLTDLRLPDLDGREVALRARQLVPAPRIALITGWDLERDLRDKASWGIDWVFTKPLDVNELLLKLREVPESPVPPTTRSQAPSYEGGEGTP
ncbi:two-component system, cell cycle response regulator CpdR [Singulisphaera sp. GP187]|uniref:response regulator n=1 Tax=Singulisphaera sp. GP187 TaxID=1882752 RepID=UPI0009264E79|nr:response regulator [Singulisphaera sp. GP187]SIN97316.1 two-component system, cell cycle response regulator CpdR [Singulisphaera sp. GP187]